MDGEAVPSVPILVLDKCNVRSEACRRVAIARSLVNDPAILLADEPTGNLDERATRGVFQLLRDINGGGTVVVMATHDLDLVRQTSYRNIELREGAIAYDSAVDDRATGTR